ncbi:HNH endonuclease (endogenous virus) [Clostridium phage phiCTC2B]|uniref:Putative HNH nuclease YajD n=1 Tax=Clostridium tetani (strain Massachusetts / E88) TaxID=212717 RepID=Q892G5_CLOTE|nr:HNH endonuclease signature motif containing protein [Clostridium tetani]YP_009276927.1 HNH endonuclease [Clostridium phage phiCT19406B]YP_009277371.1 HNH endonuclease [Clostridium phage phiCTC2B]AAO36630.1 phage-related protein [Clostridium tetani E88]AJA42787.1 HNH endonuclease family protein [Clostridium phage phiCT19406B]AJA42983.1 HNH endonuclease family protein [Clostridium phage phiCTC2B]KGI39119.1 HNH endonuclease [Clostridium tetani]KGI43688.1 HNH endonuclease [Clostridium tetani]
MLYKLCRCGKVLDYTQKYCNDCSKKFEEQNRERYRHYKKNRKDKKEQRFYVSKEWTIIRDTVKQRDRGLCKLCLSKCNITYMDTVHHIEELKDCWDKRLDPGNLISLCESCHQKVHEEYKNNKLDIQKELEKLIERGVSRKF